MKHTLILVRGAMLAACLSLGAPSQADPDWGSLPYTPHSTLQSVFADGNPAYAGGFPLRVYGILLCNPGDLFDNSPNFVPVNWPQSAFQFGGQQQTYVQSADPNDIGGTCLYMAQSMGNHPSNQDDHFSYTDAQWVAELDRLNYDPATGHPFAAGDLVEVRARIGLHYAGKFNINEAHKNTPANDFDVLLIQAGYGLPTPQDITLDAVQDANDVALFDATRQTGGERYQAQLVRLMNVTIVDATNWHAEGEIVVSDGTARTLSVVLGTDPAVDATSAPTGKVNITGIFDQEATPAPQGGLNGYRLFAPYASSFAPALCLGDVNCDGQVSFQDIDPFVARLGCPAAGNCGGACDWRRADINGDGAVTFADIDPFVGTLGNVCD